MQTAQERTNYPVAVSVDDNGTGFAVTVQAVAPADPAQVCGLVAAAAGGLARALGKDPAAPLAGIDILDPAQRRQILTTWNDTGGALPEATVTALFAGRVAAAPDAVAVTCGDACLTYAGLDAAATRLARRLAAAGAGPERVVAVVMERGIGLVTALVAVVKAGAAYLPVEPGYPAERVGFMLADAAPAVIVTDPASAGVLPAAVAAPVLVLAGDEPGGEDGGGGLAAGVGPGGAVYVMYTSGSTGVPKAVVVPHRAVVRLVRGCGFAELGAGAVVAQLAPVFLDAATFEIWGALAGGAVLAVAPGGVLAAGELGGFLAGCGVSVLWLTRRGFSIRWRGLIRGCWRGCGTCWPVVMCWGCGRARRCWRRARGCGW